MIKTVGTLVLFFLICQYKINAQIIITVAGNETVGYSGDGGSASGAVLNAPQSIIKDTKGNFFFVDKGNNCIRKINALGIITTIAGNGTAGYSGDGSVATSAQLNAPTSVAVDTFGNIFIADNRNNCIRKVTFATGIINTIAGNGTSGYSGDGGLATAALLHRPSGVVTDNSGNVYFSDLVNERIRKIDQHDSISTIAGTGATGYSGDNTPATNALLDAPYGLLIDSAKNIFFADNENNVIRKIDPSGIITTVVGTGAAGYGGDGGPASAAKLSGPEFIAADNAGNLYISELTNDRIRKVTTDGIITTIAGDGVPGFNGDGRDPLTSELYSPAGVVVDSSGVVFIADAGNNRIRTIVSSVAVPSLQNLQNQIAVYPNPANGQFTAEVSSTYEEQLTIVITDMLGRTVEELKCHTNVPININANIHSGIYFLHAISANTNNVQSIVINRTLY